MTHGLAHELPAIGDMIVNFVERYPARIAFVEDDGQELTYAMLGSHIKAAIARLEELGLKPGDSVVQIGSNCSKVFALVAACYMAGYRSVSLHAASSLEDHVYITQDCGAVIVVATDEYTQRARAIANVVPGLRLFDHAPESALPCFWTPGPPDRTLALKSSARPDAVVRIAYTGGTTGRSKGVMATSGSIAINVMTRMAGNDWSGLRFLAAAPISHGVGSMIIPIFWHGGTVVLHRGFNAGRVLAEIERRNINSLFTVPTMLYALLDYPRTGQLDCSHMKMLMYGGAPVSPSRIKEALALFGPILEQHYGQTEMPSVILGLTKDDHLDDSLLTSAGKPYPGITARLLDDDDREVLRGELGEICARGPMAMSGYLNQEALTLETMRNGWVHTGDIAYQDERGYFHIVDRKKDMIITGGFNVYPKAIENALATHPAVMSAAVIGIPDPKWGEAVMALVVLRSSEQVSEAELIAHVKNLQGSVGAPKRIEFVDELPLTAVGKFDKKAMRAPYWQDKGRNVH
ncbi:MAG: AMP-binding protein [Pseudomonadota bacterium]